MRDARSLKELGLLEVARLYGLDAAPSRGAAAVPDADPGVTEAAPVSIHPRADVSTHGLQHFLALLHR